MVGEKCTCGCLDHVQNVPLVRMFSLVDPVQLLQSGAGQLHCREHFQFKNSENKDIIIMCYKCRVQLHVLNFDAFHTKEKHWEM